MKTKAILFASIAGLLVSCGIPGPSSTSQPSAESSIPPASSSEPSVPSSSSSSPSQPSSSQTTKTSTSTPSSSSLPEIDHVVVFCETNWTHVYAWHDSSNVITASWPGDRLKDYDSDWKTYEFKNETSFSIIFNEGGSSHQTDDLTIDGAGYWWFYENSWYRENPRTGEDSSSSEDYSAISLDPLDPSLDKTHRTWYQLLVYSFADSNGDGIGDFKGIANHLDYLQTLGIGGLWLSPIHPADSYHGYDVKDYKAVNSTYEVGGYKFENLLADCHKRGISVILDMVFNHTSNSHSWRGNNGWYSGEHIFGGGMPDLNYDNSDVRKAVKDVGKYWLDKGVDGFRCDAAAWIYGGGNGWNIEQDKFQKSIAWWKEFSEAMKAIKKDVYLIGEVYTELQYVEQFYASGMNAFNFSASYWPKNAFNDNDSAKWVEEVTGHQSRVRQKDAKGVEASFLSNHDTGRFASSVGNKEQLVFSNALNVLSPGGSYVYYGDELGMTGSSDGWEDMSFRTPMPFASGKTNGQKYMGRNANTNTNSGKTADADLKDKTSICYKTALAINYKNANPALYSGKATQLSAGDKALGVMKVEGGEQNYFVLINATGNDVTASVSGTFELGFGLAGKDNDQVTATSSSVKLPARSVAILTSTGNLTVSA